MRRLLVALGALLVALALTAGGVRWFLSGDGVRIGLERQASAWLGQPVRISRATASLLPRVAVRLDDVRVGDPERLTLARVDLSTSLLALLRRRVEDADILVSGSRIEMPLPFGLPAHATSVAIGVAAVAADSIELVSIHSIALRDVTVASRDREIAVAMDSSLTGARLTISALTARFGDTVVDARGQVDLGARVMATVNAEANELDLDDLLALAAAFTAVRGEGGEDAAAARAHTTVTISAPRARIAGAPAARFEASLLAEGTDLRVEPLRFDVFGGRYDGWLDASFGPELDVRLGVGVANLDVAQLVAYGGSATALTGRLYGTGRFGARGRDLADVLAAARGVGEISLAGGTLPSSDVLRVVLRFMGRPAPSGPSSAGEVYTSMAASFALADRAVRSDDLTVRTPEFDVFARGTLTLPTRTLDAHADLVISERLSAQAGPELNRYARAGSRIVLPATIGGTLEEPRVRIDAGAAIRRGLRNEVDRRLEDLLERVRPAL